MWRLLLTVALIFTLSCSGSAQWIMQSAHTSADLRAIHAIGNGIAWASGTNGTVLRTADDGDHWENCAMPPGADAFDFRGIQAFDANTAIVMSVGKGDLSRLYKTTDACRSWRVVFTNPSNDGFFDAISFSKPSQTGHAEASGVLIGHPVGGAFAIFLSTNDGENWRPWGRSGFGWKGECGERRPKDSKDEALFSSGESILYFFSSAFLFVTGGRSGARLVYSDLHDFDGPPCWITLSSVGLPLARASSSAGAFALAAKNNNTYFPLRLMVVGGDFTKPNEASGNAAFLSSKDGAHLPLTSYFNVTTPVTPSHGFRFAVAYDAPTNTWITVGPNGTDISADDGRTWRSLTPAPIDAPDADKNWGALSLPFAVGPKGRIGKLRTEALKP